MYIRDRKLKLGMCKDIGEKCSEAKFHLVWRTTEISRDPFELQEDPHDLPAPVFRAHFLLVSNMPNDDVCRPLCIGGQRGGVHLY